MSRAKLSGLTETLRRRRRSSAVARSGYVSAAIFARSSGDFTRLFRKSSAYLLMSASDCSFIRAASAAASEERGLTSKIYPTS